MLLFIFPVATYGHEDSSSRETAERPRCCCFGETGLAGLAATLCRCTSHCSLLSAFAHYQNLLNTDFWMNNAWIYPWLLSNSDSLYLLPFMLRNLVRLFLLLLEKHFGLQLADMAHFTSLTCFLHPVLQWCEKLPPQGEWNAWQK